MPRRGGAWSLWSDSTIWCQIYAILVPKRRKIIESEGITLQDGEVTKILNEGESYKYLVVLQVDQMLYTEMKEKVATEYTR